jgi:hypothetical protein
MESQTLWLIILSVSTPIAAVVGFAVQLRTVKKTRLENEKLVLEIQTLRKKQSDLEQRIVIPTTDEVIKYNDIRFSRRTSGINPGPDSGEFHEETLFDKVMKYGFYLGLTAFIGYLLFDIYRLLIWLWSLF